MDGSSSKVVSALSNYMVGKTLGTGSFGKVRLAVHVATGHKVAIKIINRQKIKKMKIEEKVQRETKILRFLMHPHIIRQYEVIETTDNIYVVMEFVKSGELFDYIVERGRLPEDEACIIFQQIISGVEYCHRNRIVHRDLKPENMLLDPYGNIKIVDFGLSNVIQDGHFLKTSCGSPNYAAPEVISGNQYSGPEVDIWSCGIILYGLLCGTLPFDDENIPHLFHKIKSGVYTLPDHLSYHAKDLIARLLTVDPVMRISIHEIRQHPWFNNTLPHYLSAPPLVTMEQTRKINEEMIEKVVSMGFDRNKVIESIVNRIQNEATVAYYLLLDSQKSTSTETIFRSKSKEIWDGSSNSMIPAEVDAPHVAHPFASQAEDPFNGFIDHHKTRLRSQIKGDKSWTLGLKSDACPAEIMCEVFKALQTLKVSWKKIGDYNIKCRCIPSFGNNNIKKGIFVNEISSMMDANECAMISPTVLKTELQLYKVCEGKYMLDIQRIDGPLFLFMHLCFALLKELGVE